MAGVKGRSGGPRKNAGGARPGAGRKPKQPAEAPQKKSTNGGASVEVALERQVHGGSLRRAKAKAVEVAERDMLQFLQDVALGRVVVSTLQVRAAIAAVQYTHPKKGEGGKKEGKQEGAQKAAGGHFAPSAPPAAVRPTLRSVK